MNNIEFKSTFDEIEFDIAMKMYMEHNDKIASINEHLGEMYSYKDLEEAKALEEYDTLQEYKKALKEKCDAFDKAIEYIKEINNNNYSILVNGKETILDKREILDAKIGEMQKLERILRGEDNE